MKMTRRRSPSRVQNGATLGDPEACDSKSKPSGKAKYRKATAPEFESRIQCVYDMLLGGSTRADVIAESRKREWHVNIRQVDNYIALAGQRFEAQATIHRAREFGKMRARLERLYKACWTAEDYAGARAALRDLGTFLHLDTAQPILEDMPPATPAFAPLTPAEFMQMLALLLAEASQLPNDTGKAAAIANLTRAALAANEQVNLEQRMAAIEAVQRNYAGADPTRPEDADSQEHGQ